MGAQENNSYARAIHSLTDLFPIEMDVLGRDATHQIMNFRDVGWILQQGRKSALHQFINRRTRHLPRLYGSELLDQVDEAIKACKTMNRTMNLRQFNYRRNHAKLVAGTMNERHGVQEKTNA